MHSIHIPLSAFRNLCAVVLLVAVGMAPLGCYKTVPPLSTVGTLTLSVDLLRPGMGGKFNMNQPELRVASCGVRVTVPDGPRKVTAINQGMIIETSWDAILINDQDSKKGVTKVEFLNFKWAVLNPVNYGAGTKVMAAPTVKKSLIVGAQNREALFPPMSMAAPGGAVWQQQLSWSLVADWQGGLAIQTQPINIVTKYQSAHPDMFKKAKPTPRPQFRNPYGVRR